MMVGAGSLVFCVRVLKGVFVSGRCSVAPRFCLRVSLCVVVGAWHQAFV